MQQLILLFPHLRSYIDKSILEAIQPQPCRCWIYSDDTFFIWEHREDCFKQYVAKLNVFSRTIKFTVEWAREKKRFCSHFAQDFHTDLDDWEVPLFEKCETHKEFKEKEIFLQGNLKTFYLLGRNE